MSPDRHRTERLWVAWRPYRYTFSPCEISPLVLATFGDFCSKMSLLAKSAQKSTFGHLGQVGQESRISGSLGHRSREWAEPPGSRTWPWASPGTKCGQIGHFSGQKWPKIGHFPEKKCLLIILPFGTKLATFCHFFATFWPLFGHFLATFGHFLPLLATFLPQFRAFLATFRALLATFRVLQPSNHSMDPFMVSNHTYDDHPLMVTIRCVE